MAVAKLKKDTTELVTIGVELAKQYLATQKVNRSVSKATVIKYAKDMKAGKWKFSGDAIKFNNRGELIDGQHRLHAIILSGVEITCLVVYELDIDVINVLDSGRKRSTGDMLAIQGYANSNMLAAAARWLLTIKYRLPATKNSTATNNDISVIVDKHPYLAESAKIYGVLGTSPSLLAAIHYIGTNLMDKAEEADFFVRVFTRGIPADFYEPEQDPALKLRERVIRDNAFKISKAVMFNTTIYCWNFHQEHSPFKRGIFLQQDVNIIKGLDTDLI